MLRTRFQVEEVSGVGFQVSATNRSQVSGVRNKHVVGPSTVPAGFGGHRDPPYSSSRQPMACDRDKIFDYEDEDDDEDDLNQPEK